MESWIVAIIISLASGGTIFGVIFPFTNMMKKEFDTKVKDMSEQFDSKVATMVSQFNNLADHFTTAFLDSNKKQDEIIKMINHLTSIEKESTLLREMFMRHEADNKHSIERIHDRIEEIKGIK